MRHLGMALSEHEREPTIERGKDSSVKWGRILAAVVLAAIVIGYLASVSYIEYPYTVNVSGTYTSSEGAKATIIGLAACNAWVYQQCPDPGQRAAYDCTAPPEMKMASECVTYSLTASPGRYQVSLRNGENYTLTGYMTDKNGIYVKVCFETIVLSPATQQHNVTRNLSC